MGRPLEKEIMRLRQEYIFRQRMSGLGVEHIWTTLGAEGATHLHIEEYPKEYAEKYGERHMGGIEIHYREAPHYMRNDAPSQDVCWILKAPCWHDGSSLQASEKWIPIWENDQYNHAGMFKLLEADYKSRFNIEDEAE